MVEVALMIWVGGGSVDDNIGVAGLLRQTKTHGRKLRTSFPRTHLAFLRRWQIPNKVDGASNSCDGYTYK